MNERMISYEEERMNMDWMGQTLCQRALFKAIGYLVNPLSPDKTNPSTAISLEYMLYNRAILIHIQRYSNRHSDYSLRITFIMYNTRGHGGDCYSTRVLPSDPLI